jgi:CRISPR/Cas system CSM-associated protein Csm3 (group 7 of RAMP superfamily)
VPTEQWADYLAGGSPPGWGAERIHVAIDRWTGGAAAEQLFTVQETTGVRWPPLAVEVDLQFLATALPAERERRAALVLLGLAVAALVEGTVGLGGGTTRGLGEIEVTGLDVDAPGWLPRWSGVPGAEPGQRWWQWLAQAAPDGGWVGALSRAEVG